MYDAESNAELIASCIQGNRSAQKRFYHRFSPVLLGTCRRYIDNTAEAEDIMVRSILQGLKKLATLKDPAALKSWLKRIAVNNCLMHLRKKKKKVVDLKNALHIKSTTPDAEHRLNYDTLLKALDYLPTGYRTVFNLYVIEGYKHREIAQKLNISINTSKSQLLHAKKKLKEILKKINYE